MIVFLTFWSPHEDLTTNILKVEQLGYAGKGVRSNSFSEMQGSGRIFFSPSEKRLDVFI